MTANRIHFSLLIVALVGALAGCYKAPEFINPVYSCECGSVTFDDSLYNLKMAEAVVPDSLEPLSRSYHIVADLRTLEEVDAHVPAHDLTFHLSFPELYEGTNVYYVQQEDIQHLVQVINHGDDTDPILNYKCQERIPRNGKYNWRIVRDEYPVMMAKYCPEPYDVQFAFEPLQGDV